MQLRESLWMMTLNSSLIPLQVYPEQLLGRIAKKAFSNLGCKDSEFFEEMGYFFVEFVGQFGYGDVLALLGRHLRDFLNGLDNLHEYLKFSYPRLRAPSYFCDNESDQGLHLHYRSKRRGFTHYTMGQLKAVAETFYKLKLDIEVMEQEVKFDTIHVSFKLTFDNKSTERSNSALIREEARLPAVSSAILFEIFPFIMVYGEDMAIQTIGRSLAQVLLIILVSFLISCAITRVKKSGKFKWKEGYNSRSCQICLGKKSMNSLIWSGP
jgi:guanylate cyclase